MVIRFETQHKMYLYILSSSKIGVEDKPKDLLNGLLKHKIKRAASKLDKQNKLFIKKAEVYRELTEDKLTGAKKQVLKIHKNYRYKSNYLIFDTLESTGICNSLVVKHKSKIQKHSKIIDIDDIKESGSDLRKKLISLCKQYNKGIDLIVNSKTKTKEYYELKKEYTLAEEAIGKFIKEEYFKDSVNIVVEYQGKFKGKYEHDGKIKPDIFIIDHTNNKIIVIDVKVYATVGYKSNKKRIYKENSNRFQINSYMGKIKQEINNATGYDIKGILLHIVNDELWEENKSMQGTQLTIEEDRPIILYMVRDTGIDGLSNIFGEIKCMLDNELAY